ncbi:hypothetical protein GDO78_013750 [Eleutherodactylus coqui]|uniref:Uncharacterized protein n=1 Tax=Eleutherodactylus coqui TaxID=57060 RepID=A0A8J6BFG8_ELECQ|nr:hypothetical protein GDO78_013750 [Eleutherodactylus coqui]
MLSGIIPKGILCKTSDPELRRLWRQREAVPPEKSNFTELYQSYLAITYAKKIPCWNAIQVLEAYPNQSGHFCVHN